MLDKGADLIFAICCLETHTVYVVGVLKHLFAVHHGYAHCHTHIYFHRSFKTVWMYLREHANLLSASPLTFFYVRSC